MANAKDSTEGCASRFIEIGLDSSSEGSVAVKVRDSGCGIPKEIQSKIFDPFFTTKEVNKGTGLGLSIAHGIVKEHGGDIGFSSKPGNGTIFNFTLPLVSSGSELIVASQKDPIAMSKLEGNVILVDDEIGIQDVLKDILVKFGLNVHCFSNGNLALKKFNEEPSKYELIITDIKMPELSGSDLIRSVREQKFKQPKIIAMTGGVDSRVIDEGSDVGKQIDGCFFKPFDIPNIHRVIQQVLTS